MPPAYSAAVRAQAGTKSKSWVSGSTAKRGGSPNSRGDVACGVDRPTLRGGSAVRTHPRRDVGPDVGGIRR